MVYSFDDARAPERHTMQYFEMMGNGGIYHGGWSALTKHRTPWITGITALPRFTEDRWELYEDDRDASQCDDVATSMPRIAGRSPVSSARGRFVALRASPAAPSERMAVPASPPRPIPHNAAAAERLPVTRRLPDDQ